MNSGSSKQALAPPHEMRKLSQTLSGLPARVEQLATHLQYVADLIADAGHLPEGPLLAWREPGRTIGHKPIGRELVVGRQAPESGLNFADDKLLSRQHFVIRADVQVHVLEDLNSHNGTGLNRPDNRVNREILHDGDLIYAGSRVLVFLAA